MVLEENNYQEKIAALAAKDWQPLFELIPAIRKTTKFAEMKGGENNDQGISQIPYYSVAAIVTKFLEIVYRLPIIISFDWGAWDEGRKIVRDKNFGFDKLDIPTKCKLITAIVRNDRFCEGALVSAFESGLILKILESIERQITEERSIVCKTGNI